MLDTCASGTLEVDPDRLFGALDGGNETGESAPEEDALADEMTDKEETGDSGRACVGLIKVDATEADCLPFHHCCMGKVQSATFLGDEDDADDWGELMTVVVGIEEEEELETQAVGDVGVMMLLPDNEFKCDNTRDRTCSSKLIFSCIVKNRATSSAHS